MTHSEESHPAKQSQTGIGFKFEISRQEQEIVSSSISAIYVHGLLL